MSQPAPSDSSEFTVITAVRGWRHLDLAGLWRAREVLQFLSWRDLKVRYKQTILGVAWALVQPIAMSLVFVYVLARYAQVPTGPWPYFLHVFTGMLPWTFFSTAISSAGNSVVASERVVTKVYFPRLCIPFAAVLAGLVDFVLGFFLLALLLIGFGVAPSWTIFMLPIIVGLLVLAAMGLGSLLAALMVAYRDIRFVMPFLIQLMLFATPSIYLQTQAPADSRGGLRLLDFHPLDGLISGFRASVLGGPFPWVGVLLGGSLSIALFYFGCLYFRRVEDDFADII